MKFGSDFAHQGCWGKLPILFHSKTSLLTYMMQSGLRSRVKEAADWPAKTQLVFVLKVAQPFSGSKAGGEFGLTETSVAFRCLRAWFIIFFWKKVRFLSNQLLVTFQPCTHSRPRYSMHNCKIVCFPFVPLNKIFNPLDLLDAKVKTVMPWSDSHIWTTRAVNIQWSHILPAQPATRVHSLTS